MKYKKNVLYGILIFGVTLIPHIVTVVSGAFGARFKQVGSSGLEFGKHFISYFSPRNLFSDIGDGLARVSPNLGVFYDWFIVPFLMGLYFLGKFIDKKFIKFLGILAVISLIPVSLTGDVFYPLRALEFFWLLALAVSIGLFEIGELIKSKLIKWLILIGLIIYSLGSFYISYFLLFQHETTEYLGNTYIELSQELMKYKGYSVVLDSGRDPAGGLRVAYFRKYDPRKIQTLLKNQLTTPYYSGDVNGQELYIIDNIVVRPITWGKDRCNPKTILVGDILVFSDDQIAEHNLKKVFEIQGNNQDIPLRGFETNPDEECTNQL